MKFELTEDQIKKYNKWYKKLPKAYTGAIGGRISFRFVLTGIGTIIKVEDGITGKILDLTDYESF